VAGKLKKRYKIKKVRQLLNTRSGKVLNRGFPGDAFAKILKDTG